MPKSDWLGPLITGLFGFGGSALAAGQGDRQSFKGTAVDPIKLLTEAVAQTKGFGQALNKRAQAGYKVKTTIPNLPGFTADPAIADPSLLSRAGTDLGFGLPKPSVPGQGGGLKAPTDMQRDTPPDRAGVPGGRFGRAYPGYGENVAIGGGGGELGGGIAELIEYMMKRRKKSNTDPEGLG